MPPDYHQEDRANIHESDKDEQSYPDPFLLRKARTDRSAISSFDVALRTQGPSLVGSKARERSRDRRLDPLGLTVLYEPDGTPSADIIFVHGLGGSSRQTWSKNRDPALFWPLEWLPHEVSLSSARILTFGYNAHFAQLSGKANILNISDFAKELLYALRFATGAEQRPLRIGTVPIIFVAHSMGGLVTKKACILGQNDVHYRDIIQSIVSMVFLSTPHRGTDLAETLNRILSACIFAFSPKQYIEELRRNSSTLQEINDQFRNFAGSIDIISFFETQPTTVGILSLLILQRDSSTLGYPEEISKPLDADHHEVCKYSDRQDSNYRSVRDILVYLVEKFRPEPVNRNLENNSEDLERIAAFLGNPEMPLDDHDFFSDKRLEGSCGWILNDTAFSTWLVDDSPGAHILWFTGKPGSGKSVTTSFVINHMEENESTYAFYFFRFGDQVKNNLTAFLLSIAFQIATTIPEYRRRLLRLFEDGLNVQKSAPRLIWQRLFINTLFKLDVKQPIYVVVDALDETDAASLFLKFLSDLSTCPAPLRFLVVSRGLPLLVAAFERVSKAVTVSQLSLDSSEQDLRLYVDEEMQMMHGDFFFKRKIVESILQKADGNFLWVHLVVSQILDCHTEDDVEEALTQVPQELGPLYERMDSELALRSKANDQKLGLTILRWVSCSRHPLVLSELAQILELDYPRLLDLKHTVHQVCGEFVVVDKREYVTMIHSSAREYLTTNEHLNYYVDVTAAHQLLFTKCMAILTSTAPKMKTGSSHERSFMLYAATSWPFHLERSKGSLDQDTLLTIASFFRNASVLSWIHILSNHGRLRTLVQASKNLTDFLQRSDKLDEARSPLTHRLREKEDLSLWAQDLIRIVGKFGSQLILHPKTIYTLIPAFCPQQSIMYRQFASRPSMSSLVIKGSRKPYWDDCLAKFTLSSHATPVKIMTLDRYFAILDTTGYVRLHYSATCEEARTFKHGERVLTMCFSPTGEMMATYGLRRTKIWDTRTGRLRGTVHNPDRGKALAISFADSGEVVLICSDDRAIRSCPVAAPENGWNVASNVIGTEYLHGKQATSPRHAQFSPDGAMIAIAYRGLPLSVWSIVDPSPRPVGRCERSGDRVRANHQLQTNFTDAQRFCWNPITGHILGIFNDGCVFKWDPLDDDYAISPIRATNIECSADGKFFVTSSKNGMLRIWEFYHFSPIYQLSYESSVTDLAIDRNEARIYDLRDKFCNIWEPNALLRLLESEDKASETGSQKASSTHISLISDASAEDSEPIMSLSVNKLGTRYAVGDEEGVMSLYDISGSRIAEISQRFMTIEQISWNTDGNVIASSDLARSCLVQQIAGSGTSSGPPIISTISKIEQQDHISQLLLSSCGDHLLIQTSTASRIYSTEQGSEVHCIQLGHDVRWANHPTNAGTLVGFGYNTITIDDWTDSMGQRQLKLLRDGLQTESDFMAHEMTNRRPSSTYPVTPSEVEIKVTKVLLPVEGSLALVQISRATSQRRSRKEYMLLEILAIQEDQTTISPKALPAELLSNLEAPLGFISTSFLNEPNSGKSTSYSQEEVRAPRLDLPGTEQILAFVSKDSWVCTYSIGEGMPGRVKKYFFLPRDWLNMDWMELATVTTDGKLLYPRNGEVAIIEGWLNEEWTD